ncbi:unnamed protein product [Scytosiphon promiscuus]
MRDAGHDQRQEEMIHRAGKGRSASWLPAAESKEQEQQQHPKWKTTDDGSVTASAASLSLMKWSEKQSHILTGGGVASRFYRPPRFPFTPEELPHFHKSRGSTHEAFALWRSQGTGLGAEIAGAWKRPLFVGGWTHSDDTGASPPSSSGLPAQVSKEGESTFNLQTSSMFVDIRVPKAAAALLGRHRGFHTMTDFELRLFARRHAFAGYTKVEPLALHSIPSPARGDAADKGRTSGEGGKGREAAQRQVEGGGSVATRHHCIDWNYVGQPRPRPNKWRVEMGPGGDVWREWGFAKDAFDQHVYMERWERLPGGRGPFFALRRRPSQSAPDALLVVCGDHFGLIVDRAPSPTEGSAQGSSGGGGGGGGGGLVGLVDEAIARGDRSKAIEFMSLEASHGRVSAHQGRSPWTVDCSLHPWLENRRPFSGSILTVAPNGLSVDWVSQIASGASSDYSGSSSSSTGSMRNNNAQSAGRNSGESLCPGWNGARLEGVWDVVENTMLLSPSLLRPSPSSPPLPRVAPPILTLKDLLAGSGAELRTRGVCEGRTNDVKSLASPRAKL